MRGGTDGASRKGRPSRRNYAGCFLRGRDEELRFFCVPSPEVLRGARGRRCGLGGGSGIGISPVAVGWPGTSGCGSSSSSICATGSGSGGGAGGWNSAPR